MQMSPLGESTSNLYDQAKIPFQRYAFVLYELQCMAN